MNILKGSCKRCGKCCSMKNLWKTFTFKEKFLTFIVQGRKIFKLYFNKHKVKCPLLRIDKNNLAFCMQYKNRPYFCKDYPDKNEGKLIKGCGYYFV